MTSSPRMPDFGRALALLVVLAVRIGSGAPAQAAAVAIKLSPAYGPPSSIESVKGRGFGPNEVVEIDFDGSAEADATTDDSGSFTAAFTVPGSALPGLHAVSGTGESTGRTASAQFTVRTDWTKFHFDLGNSGLNPYENVLDSSNVSGLVEAWGTFVGGIVNSSPAVVDDVAYTGGSGGPYRAYVTAVDASTGALLWTDDIPGGNGTSNVAVAGGHVYVGTLGDHALHAYDASTGSPVWTFQASGGMQSPIVVEGVVYAPANNSTVYAIDAAEGTQIWSSFLGAGLSFGAPALVDGILYVGTQLPNGVDALDPATGTVLWRARTGRRGSVYGSPTVADSMLFVGAADGYLDAFDASDGVLKWRTRTGGVIESTPAAANGIVYVGSNDGRLYAFDEATGTTLWNFPTGSFLGQSSPCVANGVVYFGGGDGTIYALDAASGNQLWSFPTGGPFATAPAISDGVLYMGSFDKRLYAFHLP